MLTSLHRFHATMSGVAGVFHEAARNAPLLVDARAANDIVRAAPEDNGPGTPPVQDATVAPRDVLHRRAIPLPGAIRGHAEEVGRQAAVASRAALRSTLAASDGVRDDKVLPVGRSRPEKSIPRLAAARTREQQGATPRSMNVAPLHPSR